MNAVQVSDRSIYAVQQSFHTIDPARLNAHFWSWAAHTELPACNFRQVHILLGPYHCRCGALRASPCCKHPAPCHWSDNLNLTWLDLVAYLASPQLCLPRSYLSLSQLHPALIFSSSSSLAVVLTLTLLYLIVDSRVRRHDAQQYHCQCAPQFALVSRDSGPVSLRCKALQGLRSIKGL
jgi:hypothetical protein